ncbi:MFS transporter [Litchfieldia alkalitelluris]|uniref:MFS transporter n=1 Tax=Litchfieldia alkalitelluris TaxID=304268 RepID=UPI001F41A4A6|nr:MFS transporter [Litchfieldia alkalitelluris]
MSVASITPLIYAIIGDIAPSHRRGTWLSIVVSGHLTALWAGAPFGTLLEHLLGWRSVFIVIAILGTILALVNFKTWRYVPKSDVTRNLLEGNLLRIIGSVSVTTSWAISMYALYSENRFSSSEIALAVTFYGIGAVLGSLISRKFTDRFGARKISKATLIFLDCNIRLFRNILLIWRLDLFLSVHMGFGWVCRIYIIPSTISRRISKGTRKCYGLE